MAFMDVLEHRWVVLLTAIMPPHRLEAIDAACVFSKGEGENEGSRGWQLLE